MIKLVAYSVITGLFAAMPSSSNYQLNNYNYGSGGTTGTSSTNYSLDASTGQATSSSPSSTNYTLKPGNNNAQQADVPPAPNFSNPANHYNKLLFSINPASNPSDTKFSIAISTDNFVTTRYVQNDNTIGNARGIEDYQTYAAWGGAGGQFVVGLAAGTTYQIKVNAFQGNYTETEYGPSSSASTVAPNITFDIDVSSTDSETSPPYITNIGNLLPSTITTTSQRVWIDLDTNANNGAMIYVRSANNGLYSSNSSFTLTSTTANLSAVSSGYGARGMSIAQSSGGPLTITAPYNGAGENVGLLDTALRQMFSASAPITGGRASFVLKAKSAPQTPPAGDYQDVLTIVVAGSY